MRHGHTGSLVITDSDALHGIVTNRDVLQAAARAHSGQPSGVWHDLRPRTNVTTSRQPPSWLQFFERPYPSANGVLVSGDAPVLVDSGFGTDTTQTAALLSRAGVYPGDLALVVNTHYHSDHVGGNAALQSAGVPIAAHRWEADLVNRRHREACGARWLGQPVAPYSVDRMLSDHDEIDTGAVTLQVLHTPGHTSGHVALYEPESGTLICGDAIHANDVGWINPFRDGVASLRQAKESVERLARLTVRWACSGHGPAFGDAPAVFAAALTRYDRWLRQPEAVGWHACKRIFAFALIISGGMDADEVVRYLLASRWFCDHARDVFDLVPEDFIDTLMAEMIRSGAAKWELGRLVATAPHSRSPLRQLPLDARPHEWPDR